MANELNLSISLSFQKNGAIIQRQLSAQFNVSGSAGIQVIQNIGTSDETLNLGDVATPGFLLLHNLAAFAFVVTPTAPTIGNVGTAGAVTWSYKAVARQSDGAYSAASSAGSTATGNATLTTGNYNTITWPAVTGMRATDFYDIYRTAHGTSPTTDGLIGTVAGNVLTLDDTGQAGDASTPPATGIDNVIEFGSDGSVYPNQLKGQEFSIVRWQGAAIHCKALTLAADLESILIPD